MGTQFLIEEIRSTWLYKISFFGFVVFFTRWHVLLRHNFCFFWKWKKVLSHCACFISKILGDAINQQPFTGMNLDVFDPHRNVSIGIVVISPTHWDRGWLTSRSEVCAVACAGGVCRRRVPAAGPLDLFNSRVILVFPRRCSEISKFWHWQHKESQ